VFEDFKENEELVENCKENEGSIVKESTQKQGKKDEQSDPTNKHRLILNSDKDLIGGFIKEAINKDPYPFKKFREYPSRIPWGEYYDASDFSMDQYNSVCKKLSTAFQNKNNTIENESKDIIISNDIISNDITSNVTNNNKQINYKKFGKTKNTREEHYRPLYVKF
jgi:hypothetical protein